MTKLWGSVKESESLANELSRGGGGWFELKKREIYETGLHQSQMASKMLPAQISLDATMQLFFN